MKEFVIDLFCGAGGTSTGIHLANCDTQVTACVNHDSKAIESHRLNHPKAKHFIEDIRNPEVVFFLKLRVDALRKLYPHCIITIWASLECTNFSKAKGGLPRDADSRTLADHLFMYLDGLHPDYLMIENVIEFMAWGPLCEKGKPVSMKKGTDYLKWIDKIKSRGYRFDWKELNAADFGAYTSRKRYFAQFAKGNFPISWPEKTHAKKPAKTNDLFYKPLKKWKPVKEVLKLELEGQSIFNRKKPLVENTLKRIYAGLVKFVANGDDSFLKKYYSGRPEGKVISVDGPAGTIKTADGHAYVKCDFLQSYYGNGNAHSTDEPCPTVSTKDRFGKVTPEFLIDYQYNSGAKSIKEPSPTLLTKDKFAKVKATFITNYYNGGGQLNSVEQPSSAVTGIPKQRITECFFVDQQYGNSKPKSIYTPSGAITQNPKEALVKVEGNQHYILNPQFKNTGNSVEKPCPTIIARQDKKPLSLISCEKGSGFMIPIYSDDTPTMVNIKIFMAHFGIVDIKMRMLIVDELLRIQGFPKGYQLVGNQTDQKKFIGNSVEVTVAKKLFEAHHESLIEHFEKLKAA
ncbi:MAG TPA: DNA cytosine methyltransferase [Flavobacteriaceae bacterium]|nr:DNA cytosine methyltransferase [Flavobacteriaceae bacterium]